MDFTLSARENHWRTLVKDFIEARVRAASSGL